MSYSKQEFEQLYTSNVIRAMRLAISLLGNEDEARDVVHDVFLKLWESDIETENIENPQAFILRSVRNACMDRIKSLSIRERVKESLPLETMTSDDDVGQRQADLLEAVERLLSCREKEIIDKVYTEGLSYKEAAQSLDVSVSAINQSLVRAMKTLRNHFTRIKKK